MPDSTASGQSGIGMNKMPMLGAVRYRYKRIRSCSCTELRCRCRLYWSYSNADVQLWLKLWCQKNYRKLFIFEIVNLVLKTRFLFRLALLFLFGTQPGRILVKKRLSFEWKNELPPQRAGFYNCSRSRMKGRPSLKSFIYIIKKTGNTSLPYLNALFRSKMFIFLVCDIITIFSTP